MMGRLNHVQGHFFIRFVLKRLFPTITWFAKSSVVGLCGVPVAFALRCAPGGRPSRGGEFSRADRSNRSTVDLPAQILMVLSGS